MGTLSEDQLEKKLIKQLVGLNYEFVKLDGDTIVANLKKQLELFNDTTFSKTEFEAILNDLDKGTVFEKSKKLREPNPVQFKRDNGDNDWINLLNTDSWDKNRFQVTNQVTQYGKYENRYDVTLLVNGLPMVQIELKKSGLGIKKAFNQITRYIRHSFWSNFGLYQYIQIHVISNDDNTKYFANNPIEALNIKQTFYWGDEKNKRISDLTSFTKLFLNKEHLFNMLANYVVPNEAFKVLMVLRPYQFYAAEAIVKQVKTNKENGYIWHTTGSGKTLTSFKASQIVRNFPEVDKVVFVVDRRDLDDQTMIEFDSFKKDSVDVSTNTKSLVKHFAEGDKLILTTIQKLRNAITAGKYEKSMLAFQDKRVVFIFDECHRSQFGKTHKNITGFFKNSQLFGFTGTPIFAENASKNEHGKRTTEDLFGKCLHDYTIKDAINDENVLKFSIEYVGRYKKESKIFLDIDVEDIDKSEVINSPKRLEKITDFIIKNHNQKTTQRDYSAMFAVSSIPNLIKYYEFFKAKKEAGKHDLKIATIFSYDANEDPEDALGLMPDETGLGGEEQTEKEAVLSREKLDSFIKDYNKMYNTAYSTKDKGYENYFRDISKRIKGRDKKGFNEENRIDILLVVSMFLTGFDARKLNTMYVDKNLRYHGLIQAFSRTNRILDEKKSQGNIVCFRNLKANTDEALRLFSDKDNETTVILPPYEEILKKFNEAFVALIKIAPTAKSVDDIKSEAEQLNFVIAFRRVIRLMNVLKSYAEFSWDDITMSESSFNSYSGKYIDLKPKVTVENEKQKASILDDIDFELEILHTDNINVDYILALFANIKNESKSESEKTKKRLLEQLSGDPKLKSKMELIMKFIEENLPSIKNTDDIPDEFDKYWEKQKIAALTAICKKEKLNQKQFKALVDTYLFDGIPPNEEDVIECLGESPSIFERDKIGKRIIEKMKKYVEMFEYEMSA